MYGAASRLLHRGAVAKDLIMTNGIAFLAAAVAGIAFHGVDISVLYPFHDTNMVGTSILSVRVRVVPIKEDDVAGARLIAAVLPQTAFPEPCHTRRTPCELRNNAVFDIAALVGAPGHKAGAPLHTGVKPIPRPIRHTAHIADLRQGHRYDLVVAGADAI